MCFVHFALGPGLYQRARRGRRDPDTTQQTATQLQQIFAELLAHAQEAGVARTDVDSQDARVIVLAAVTAERRRANHTRPGHLADLVLDSLRP
ncbi:hypothetical protein ACQP2T_56640 [Nonomuraea sp. CA-143628]|uniref:SbtR family transcriptional regulator n=1 Tax=Nonomuraea sp. CA-143628 TaxID=3239997 RepID=UPI003D8BA37D